MKAIIQRVSRAEVFVDSRSVGCIGHGWLVLIGVAKGDTVDHADKLADKILALRGFEDFEGKMNLDVKQAGGSILAVSQFTLMADCRKGTRPGFSDAADPVIAEPLYERFVAKLRGSGLSIATGIFRATMQVELVNDGPVTFLLEIPRAD